MFSNCITIAMIMPVAKLYRNRVNGVILFFQGIVGQHYRGVTGPFAQERERKGTPYGKNIMDKDTMI